MKYQKITLNKEVVETAVDYWLNNVFLNDVVSVQSVVYNASVGQFEIAFTTPVAEIGEPDEQIQPREV